MRKLERKIVWISAFAGVFCGLMDVALDVYSLSYTGSNYLIKLLLAPQFHGILIFIYIVVAGLIISNITGKKRIVIERYEHLFNNIEAGIFVFPFDARGLAANFTDVNAIASRKWGYSREELLQLSPENLVLLDELPENHLVWEKFKADKHILFETILVTKSGAQIPVEINAHIVQLDDQPQVLAIVRDISERKQRGEEIRRLASFPQLDPNPILEVDNAGKITYYNLAARETLKRLGVEKMEAFLPEDLPEILRAARKGGVTQFYREKGIAGALFGEFIHFVPQYNLMRLHPADITVRRQAENALRESEQQLRVLTSRLLTVQETERRRISGELHDELGQALLYLKLKLGAAHEMLRKDQVSLKKDCQTLLQFLDGIIENVRRLSRDLSPKVLEEMGLSSAIKYWLEEFGKYFDVKKIDVDIEKIDDLFSQKVQLHIYRIFQECLTNIGKHSQATQISLAVRKQDGRVAFTIHDNGQGFEVMAASARESYTKGIGLATMAERVRMVGGTLEIRSNKGIGTQITFTIPTDGRRKPEDALEDGSEDAPLQNSLG